MMILEGRLSANNKWAFIRSFDDMEINEIIHGLYGLQSDIEENKKYRINTRCSEYKIVLENGKEINSSIVYLILTNYREDVL